MLVHLFGLVTEHLGVSNFLTKLADTLLLGPEVESSTHEVHHMLLVVLLGALDHVLTVALAVNNVLPLVESALKAGVVHTRISVGKNTFALTVELVLELIIFGAFVGTAVLAIAQVAVELVENLRLSVLLHFQELLVFEVALVLPVGEGAALHPKVHLSEHDVPVLLRFGELVHEHAPCVINTPLVTHTHSLSEELGSLFVLGILAK